MPAGKQEASPHREQTVQAPWAPPPCDLKERLPLQPLGQWASASTAPADLDTSPLLPPARPTDWPPQVQGTGEAAKSFVPHSITRQALDDSCEIALKCQGQSHLQKPIWTTASNYSITFTFIIISWWSSQTMASG